MLRNIELLSPAKDLQCAVEAIRHGADAVYIGASKFGARAAAGNSIEDIDRLCRYAHLFGVRIYVTINTILKNDELAETERLIHQLYEVGVDALIVQDMAITQLDIPPIPLHASTQMDNCTPEKVDFLHRVGFEQVVIARELSLQEIERISKRVPEATLEAFVHGALCVSFSGRCYLSSAMTGRSANRGECAQCCRLPYTMIDSDGKIIAKDSHLLSLRDMNRSNDLEAMIRAGVSSFKIEGRLKDISYVKNITALYRQKLDDIINRSSDLKRSSVGNHKFFFTPKAEKSFNRGFTQYFLHQRSKEITSFETPKSKGEQIGKVSAIYTNYFVLRSTEKINNGDGLIFINKKRELEGFRVNRVEGDNIFPAKMPDGLTQNTILFRNSDKAFEAVLSRDSAERKISVTAKFSSIESGFSLCFIDETGVVVEVLKEFQLQQASKSQRENIMGQLEKLGNTPFFLQDVEINMPQDYFVPSSLLSQMRREAVERLIDRRLDLYGRPKAKSVDKTIKVDFPQISLDYTANVYNSKAKAFFEQHNVHEIQPAFEVNKPKNATLMFTRHCLRYSMGWCPVYQKGLSPFREPYFLVYKNTRLRLVFDCSQCQMQIVGENV